MAMNSDPGHRIVCAANRFKWFTEPSATSNYTFLVVPSVRHWDHHMHMVMVVVNQGMGKPHQEEQGFLDNNYKFLSRTEAWKVAEAAGQIIRSVGGDTKEGGTLYSENLY